MRPMASKEFQSWLAEIGPVEAARKITEYEEARGRRGLTYQSIQDWLKSDIPPNRVPAVEAVSGISRADLLPDLFGEPDAAA